MASPYRVKYPVNSNVQAPVTIEGRFTLGTNGAVGTVRPSAGANPAAGAGNLYAVAQLATFASKTNANAYQITFTENYFANVSQIASYQAAFSATAAPTNYLTAQCTQYDATTNSFVVYLVDEGTIGGAAAGPDIAEAVAVGEIYFRAEFINTVSPQTT